MSFSISLTPCQSPSHFPYHSHFVEFHVISHFHTHLVLFKFGDIAKAIFKQFVEKIFGVQFFPKFLSNSLYPGRQTLQLTQAQCVERICLKETVFHRPRIGFLEYTRLVVKQVVNLISFWLYTVTLILLYIVLCILCLF